VILFVSFFSDFSQSERI